MQKRNTISLWFCRLLLPITVLIVLELAPLTLRKLKDDNKTREIQNLQNPLLPPPRSGEGGLTKMARIPKGENLFVLLMHERTNYHPLQLPGENQRFLPKDLLASQKGEREQGGGGVDRGL